MSCYLVYCNDGVKMMRPVPNAAEYRALRDSDRQRTMVADSRNGVAAAKRRLLQMNYSCMPNADGSLRGAVRPTRSVGMDVDFDPSSPDYHEKMKSVPGLVLARREELGLLMLERSVGKGFHIVFRRRSELSQEDNLRWASSLLGVQYDEGAKDITRVFFTTTASPADLLYLDDSLFDNTPDPDAPAADAVMAAPAAAPDTGGGTNDERQQESQPAAPCPPDGHLARVVEALEEQLGGRPVHGGRNSFIFSMACHLRYLCHDDPKQIAAVLPDYGEERSRWMSTIQSACSRPQSAERPPILQRAIAVAERSRPLTASDECDEVEGTDGSGNGSAPPPMPERLPPLIALLVSKTPDIYKAAVAHAVFPSLGAHLCRTRFRYIDNVDHEATLMNVLMAGSGAGKNCIVAPIDHIMKDIRARDEQAIEREEHWRNSSASKGDECGIGSRPKGLVIQEVDPDMTNAALVLRLSESEEHFLYARMNEIDQFDALKTSAKSKSQFQIMCLAFDPGNTYGQTRAGAQSVSKRVSVRFNWNASTTISKGKRYFRQVLTDGPISRINFCTIPERPIGAPMPVYGIYDDQFDLDLKPYIDRLNAARGLIGCADAQRLARQLMEENAEFARLSQSRVYENLSFRANVIAYLKAMVLYVAHGYQWSQEIEDFVRWSATYDMWCKMHFFGEAIKAEEEMAYNQTRGTRGPRNMLVDLPQHFTFSDALEVRRRNDLPPDKTMGMIQNWKNRGYIEKVSEESGGVWMKCS